MNENNQENSPMNAVPLKRLVMCDFNEVKRKNPNRDQLPDSCQCHCEEEGCGWKGTIGDCGTAWDSEGWEYPDYEVLVCPKCGEYEIAV